jgi:uncharacterized protein (TIGR04255 family)
LRFDGQYPGEALYGILIDALQDFPNPVQILPAMQIPQDIRNVDQNWKYQPIYQWKNDRFSFAVGTHSLVFGALPPYKGWSGWSAFMDKMIKAIRGKKIINHVERLGLRIIDVFDENIFEHVDTELFIGKTKMVTPPVTVTASFLQNKIQNRVNISNAATILGQQAQKSAIDIDSFLEVDLNTDDFFDSYKMFLTNAHVANKQIFFGLLNKDYLQKFGPDAL